MPEQFHVPGPALNRMITELRENMEKMKSVEQMQFVRELVAGLAHEIINPITGIKGALEIFYRELDLSAGDKAVFEEMLHQVKKLDVLTKNFLGNIRPPSLQSIPTNIHEVIHYALDLITRYDLHRNARNVTVVKEFDDSIPLMQADPVQLQQVFLNLTLSAMDAMPEGGTLTFRTAHLGDAAEIRVSDTGRGLVKELANKIFQPFFTTETRGFGVGLSVSKRVIEQHGGEIIAESGDAGTVFRITFPLSAAAFPDVVNHTESVI
jgi:signal transduction histidine kinase